MSQASPRVPGCGRLKVFHVRVSDQALVALASCYIVKHSRNIQDLQG
jgi:hypothetical protein